MTTQQTAWTIYTGSDEQIAELSNAKEGVCLMFEHIKESFVYKLRDLSMVDGVVTLSEIVLHYMIIEEI